MSTIRTMHLVCPKCNVKWGEMRVKFAEKQFSIQGMTIGAKYDKKQVFKQIGAEKSVFCPDCGYQYTNAMYKIMIMQQIDKTVKNHLMKLAKNFNNKFEEYIKTNPSVLRVYGGSGREVEEQLREKYWNELLEKLIKESEK